MQKRQEPRGWSRLVVGCCMVAFTPALTGANPVQRSVPLASLTVAGDNLPIGCRLRPYVQPTPAVVRDGKLAPGNRGWSFPFSSNPWVGTDRRLIIEVRKKMDGELRLPDAPPMTAAEVSALEQRWVADIVEGYRAEYVSTQGTAVTVLAIRFNDPKLAETTQDRLVIGTVVVRVRGDSKDRCFEAIDRYLRGLK